VLGINVIFAVAITILQVSLTLKGQAASLLRPKPPAKGGKIFLERIGVLWRILPFRYKSTIRNIIRYKSRLILTVISVAFSTALVFGSIALSFVLQNSNPELMDYIRPISAFLAVSAVVLMVLVLYNITNINISERKREIATLKVLGYKNIEVAGYVFRELAILCLIAIGIGLPLGYGFMLLIFEELTFGGIEYLDWFVWIITAVLSVAGVVLTDLLLLRKITRVDMTGSLKAVE